MYTHKHTHLMNIQCTCKRYRRPCLWIVKSLYRHHIITSNNIVGLMYPTYTKLVGTTKKKDRISLKEIAVEFWMLTIIYYVTYTLSILLLYFHNRLYLLRILFFYLACIQSWIYIILKAISLFVLFGVELFFFFFEMKLIVCWL